MNVITRRRLREAWQTFPDVEMALRRWDSYMRRHRITDFVALRQRFPSADLVGRLTIFNIRGNNYRLIVRVEYERQEVYIRHFLTHAEYDKGEWKNDAWL